MEEVRENKKINEEAKSQGRPQYIDVNVPGGFIRATACIDPDYPGIDIEFVPDKMVIRRHCPFQGFFLRNRWRMGNFVQSSGEMK